MHHILIVDDEPHIRDILSAVLEDEGYAVATAPDGQVALEQVTTDPPALLITDVRMPRLDGWSLATRVRERFPTLPVIVLSAIDRPPRRPGVAAPDHTVFLAKPFDLEKLLAIVARLLGT